MIESAYISGPLGRAIVLGQERAWLLFADSPAETIACVDRDLSMFLGSGAEFFELSGDDLSLDDVGRALVESSNSADGLARMITGLDPMFTVVTRSLSIDVAEKHGS